MRFGFADAWMCLWSIVVMPLIVHKACLQWMNERAPFRPARQNPSSCSILSQLDLHHDDTQCRYRRSGRMVLMTRSEALMWARFVAGGKSPPARRRRYLEWGMGGTTEAAAMLASHGSLHITSVDSSSQFATVLQSTSVPIQQAVQAGWLSLHVVDVGKTAKWGYPANWSNRSTQDRHVIGTAYATAGGVLHVSGQSKQRHAGKDELYDVVFVDGRWRLACALHARRLLRPNGTVIVHDYTRYRKQLAEWYYPWQLEGRLAVLKPRNWKAPHRIEERPDLTAGDGAAG